jgi:hypothetical protein
MSKRDTIIGLLELLASEEEQLAYERDVPHVDITTELVCMWFDDQYHPERGFDTLFSPDELSALSKFHQFYDERVNRLPKSLGTVRTWLADSVWQEIMKQAQTTLKNMAEQDRMRR